MSETTKNKIVTPKGRLDFPNLFTPSEYKQDDGSTKEKYETVIIFDKVNLKQLHAAVEAAMDEKWPNKAKRPKNLKLPIKNGSDTRDADKYPHYQGKVYLQASSQFRPQVIDGNKDVITDPDKIYSGCYGYLLLDAFAWKNEKAAGVSFNLYAVQFAGDCADEERFAKKEDHSEAFEFLSGESDESSDEGDGDDGSGLF